MRRAVPDVVMSTMGQSTLTDLALDKPYRWRGVPDWTPGDVRFNAPSITLAEASARRAERRAERLKEYIRLREVEGLDQARPGNASIRRSRSRRRTPMSGNVKLSGRRRRDPHP